MLRGLFFCLLLVLSWLTTARTASGAPVTKAETRVGVFALAMPTLIRVESFRSLENHRENSSAYDHFASGRRFRWKGRWWNEASRTVDMRAREWSPELGVFLSIDGLGYFDTKSTLWGWPEQNPLRYSDPSGNCPGCIGALIGGIGGGVGYALSAPTNLSWGAFMGGALQAMGVGATAGAALAMAPGWGRMALGAALLATQGLNHENENLGSLANGALLMAAGQVGKVPCPAAGAGAAASGAEGIAGAEGLGGLAPEVGNEIGILRDAMRGRGNYGLGAADRATAENLGRAWVGDGASVASDGKTLVSSDGLRQFRPPSWKPYLGRFQANFERRLIPQGPWSGNGHLDISFGPEAP